MLTLSHVFYLIGALLAGTALLNVRERRWPQAAFWAILAVPCLAGDQILAANKAGTQWPAQGMGAGVIALAVLAAISRARPVVDHPDEVAAREALATRLGDLLFVPVLAIPVVVAALVLLARPSGSPVP